MDNLIATNLTEAFFRGLVLACLLVYVAKGLLTIRWQIQAWRRYER